MEKNVKALLAKIFGIVSLVLGICGGSGLPFGVAALILSNLAKKTDPDNKDAKLGGTLGLIGIILSVIGAIVTIVIYSVSFASGFAQ